MSKVRIHETYIDSKFNYWCNVTSWYQTFYINISILGSDKANVESDIHIAARIS